MKVRPAHFTPVHEITIVQRAAYIGRSDQVDGGLVPGVLFARPTLKFRLQVFGCQLHQPDV